MDNDIDGTVTSAPEVKRIRAEYEDRYKDIIFEPEFARLIEDVSLYELDQEVTKKTLDDALVDDPRNISKLTRSDQCETNLRWAHDTMRELRRVALSERFARIERTPHSAAAVKSAKQKARRFARQLRGLCIRCRKGAERPVEAGKVHCRECGERQAQKERARRKRMRKQGK